MVGVCLFSTLGVVPSLRPLSSLVTLHPSFQTFWPNLWKVVNFFIGFWFQILILISNSACSPYIQALKHTFRFQIQYLKSVVSCLIMPNQASLWFKVLPWSHSTSNLWLYRVKWKICWTEIHFLKSFGSSVYSMVAIVDMDWNGKF